MTQKLDFAYLTGDTLRIGNTTIDGTGVYVNDAAVSGVSVYANTDVLPTSGLDVGTQAFVQSTNRLYIWNGVGWYSIALVNTNPALTVEVSDITLGSSGNTINFTYSATDADENPLTVTVTTTANSSQANITLYTSNSTVTVENLSADPYDATIDLTVTDGLGYAYGTVTLTVAFEISFASVPIANNTIAQPSLNSGEYFGRDLDYDGTTAMVISGQPQNVHFYTKEANNSFTLTSSVDYSSVGTTIGGAEQKQTRVSGDWAMA